MNSVSEALYFNVPLILTPQGADQFWIAGRVAELGAGIVLKGDAVPLALRETVESVLGDPKYSRAAGRIGESLRGAGGYVKAADEIISFRRALCSSSEKNQQSRDSAAAKRGDTL